MSNNNNLNIHKGILFSDPLLFFTKNDFSKKNIL